MESSSASSSALLAGSSSPSSAGAIPATPPKKYIRDTKNGKLKINLEYELYMKSKLVTAATTIASLSTTSSTTNTDTTLQSTTTKNSAVIIDESSTIISSQSSQLQQSSQWVPIIATTTTAAAAATVATTTAVTTMTMTASEEANDDNHNDHDINEDECYDKISLAYLARLSREVYDFDNDTNDNDECNENNEIIEVGPDKFTIHILNDSDNDNESSKQKKKGTTLIIAICGTFSPIQHIMNIMPHAYQTLYTVKEIFNNNNNGTNNNGSGNSSSLKDVQSSMRNLTHKDDDNSSNAGQHEQQEYDAYTAGHEHGWTEPARKIYEEILIRVLDSGGSLCSDDDDNANAAAGSADTAGTATAATADLNDLFDKIIITGHSRGGLLAYYVGLNFLNNTNTPQQQPQSYYNGPLIRVVGFGMPSPLQEVSDNDYRTKQFIQNNVISIVNRYDPVANNTLPTTNTTSLMNWWNPILVEIGSKIKKKPPVQKPKESSSKKKTTGSSLWGLVSNVVSIAVNAVTDKATELKYDIENNHTIYEYEQFMTIDNNDQDNSNEDNDNNVILPSCVVIINDDNDNNNDIDIGDSNSSSKSNSTLQLLLPTS